LNYSKEHDLIEIWTFTIELVVMAKLGCHLKERSDNWGVYLKETLPNKVNQRAIRNRGFLTGELPNRSIEIFNSEGIVEV